MVVNVRPLSLVTEPGFARVLDDERSLTTIECEGCELRECVLEETRSDPLRSPLGKRCGRKASTDAKRPDERCVTLGCKRAPCPEIVRSTPPARA